MIASARPECLHINLSFIYQLCMHYIWLRLQYAYNYIHITYYTYNYIQSFIEIFGITIFHKCRIFSYFCYLLFLEIFKKCNCCRRSAVWKMSLVHAHLNFFGIGNLKRAVLPRYVTSDFYNISCCLGIEKSLYIKGIWWSIEGYQLNVLFLGQSSTMLWLLNHFHTLFLLVN